MEKLHPGAKWIFRLTSYSRYFLFSGLLFYMSIFKIIKLLVKNTLSIASLIIISGMILLTIVIIIVEIYTRMSYNRYLFEIKENTIKIEKGIIWKKYISIPYDRVQNINIKQGIIARILKFSTLEIETAGQSGNGTYGFGRGNNGRYQSEGYLPGIDQDRAEKIREFIMKKIKEKNSSGL